VVQAPVLVTPPAYANPLPYDLLSVSDVTTSGDPHWIFGGVAAETAACVTGATERDVCAPGAAKVGQGLYGSAITSASGPLFAYVLSTCRLVGGATDTTSIADAEKALDGTEGPIVEAQFMAEILAPNATDVTPPGAPAGGVPFKVGIGVLEAYAAQHYGGVPILHMPRSLVQTSGLSVSDGALRTVLTTPVAAGAGYERPYAPKGTQIAAGAAFTWLYVTGAVSIEKSAMTTRRVDDLVHNEFSVLAERAYAPLVQCLVAAVKVAIPAAVG